MILTARENRNSMPAWLIYIGRALRGTKRTEVDEHGDIRMRGIFWARFLGQADFRSPVGVRAAVRGRTPGYPGGAGPARPFANAARAGVPNAISRSITTAGCADCALSGLTGRANPGGRHISRTGGRGRSLGAKPSGFEGRRSGAGRGPRALGPKRQGPRRIPLCAREYGQESLLDLLPGRRVLQPATGCDGRHSGDAPEGRASG